MDFFIMFKKLKPLSQMQRKQKKKKLIEKINIHVLNGD